MEMNKKRVIIGMSGATGQVLGIKTLKILNDLGSTETYLIISETAKEIIQHELELNVTEVKKKADKVYDNKDLDAPLASGSFKRNGMVVVPCSMKTLSSLANGYSNNLIARAGDVTLKERSRLIVVPREKPLNRTHLNNMLKLSEAGGIIMPPVPSFYHNPESIEDIINEIVLRIIDLLDITNKPLHKEWKGFEK